MKHLLVLWLHYAPKPPEVPATPSASEAREAAAQELAKPIYQDHPSLISIILRWIETHLSPTAVVPALPAWLSYTISFLAAIALIALIIRLASRLSFTRKHNRSEALFTDASDANTLTRAADQAAVRGDFAIAVVERFRAIIRSLDERALIEEYPGMTAHEAVTLGADALPVLAQNFSFAGNLFDTVRYGEVRSTAEQDIWMRQFADQVAQTNPPQQAFDTVPNPFGGAA